MRKQTKVVAVASAAALLAIGASMTSFAATGWVEEDGQWYFYDKDSNRVEDVWKKSGDNWYWLDSEENGAMAVDKLVEDSDDTYYVDANGVMVRNTWVKVVNEDQDDEDDPAEYNYYYMQSNGKAYKAPDSGTTKFRTIDGKRYAFDDDGKMLYGWVDGTGNRLSGETDWIVENEDVYYCGNWDDGAMKTGWQKIAVVDNDDEDQEYWFWFKSNGKRYYNDTQNDIKVKTVNGKKYGFDEYGVMAYQWTIATTSDGTASSSSWLYFNSPEDGARVTKGWFKVIPADDEDNTFKDYSGATFASTDADDEKERWYYADGDGNLASGEIKKIKGKYYGFRPDDGAKGAAMLNGLVLMEVNNKGEIVGIADDDVDADELDDILDGKTAVADGYSLYYFGNDEDHDGAMKTGSTTVTLDGENYNFYFSKSGGVEGKGKGQSGIDDKKYIYMYGCRLKADSDDKYQVVKVTATDDTTDANGKLVPGDRTLGSDTVKVEKVDSRELRNNSVTSSTKNKDDEYISYVGTVTMTDYRLVNASGAITKTKTAAKDGADWYFYVDDQEIKMYTNNKTLDSAKDNNNNALKNWKDIVIK